MNRVLVVHNPRSGSTDRLQAIRRAFAAHHVEPDYIAITDRHLQYRLKEISSQKDPILVVAGGDGTVRTMASAVRGTSCKLGIIPTGTLNHFARELAIPSDIPSAVDRIVNGRSRRVDMGSVNGRGFVNNSSIGLYPRSLRTRETYRPMFGKWPAAVIGFLRALIRPRQYHVELSLKGECLHFQTPFVMVTNNSYRRAPNIGERTSLSGGQLAVYIMNAQGVLPGIRMLVHALFTRKYRTQDFKVYLTESCIIRTPHHRQLNVACDGEVIHMRTPLRYRTEPQTLRIIT